MQLKQIMGSKTLTKNKTKDIIKVMRSFKHRAILLNGTTEKIISQKGGLLNFLNPLMRVGLRLLRNVFTPLAKSVLVPLELTAVASATHAAIRKKIYRSLIIISNEEMDDIMKIVKSLEESGLLIKGTSETIKNEAKEQKRGVLGMLLGTLGASLLGNLLTVNGTIRAGEATIRAGQDF